VKNLVERDPGFDINEIVNAAEQIGGPRWIEADIVQVRVSVPASKLIDKLSGVPTAQRDPRVTPADLDRFQKDYARRTFQGTGQAFPVARIKAMVTSIQSPTWRDVTADARADAASRAHASAVNTVVDSSASIRVGPTQTVGQSWTDADARQKIVAYIATLPATRLLLRDDRQVEIGIYVDKDSLTEQLRAAMPTELTSRSEQLQALQAGVSSLPTIVIGRANVADRDAAPAAPAIVLRKLPDWVNDPIVAEGSASFAQSKLRTARLAEATAQQALRTKIEKLKLDDDTTFKQAQARDGRVSEAISRAVARARAYQVDYNADNSVTVRVTLDPNELLDELTGAH
jgi:hypothetical protein